MKRMKSDQVRVNWRDVLDDVQAGESVIVERYNRPVARVIPDDDTLVVLRVSDANQAARLRRLVREHGALGIPFPNNSTSGWTVVDENREPVYRGSIPSVAVQLISAEEPTYTANVGVENAEWITSDPEMRAMLNSGDVADLGDGRIRISVDGHAILSGLTESADGLISDGQVWFEGDGYALTAAS